MDQGYEAIRPPRFIVETVDGRERIRIKAQRSIFAMLFLPFWLTGWTVGGIAAITQLMQRFDLFLLIWLCCWALGWIAATVVLAWMFFGSEILTVTGSDLEIRRSIPGWSRRKLYRGSEIRGLRASAPPAWPYRNQINLPFQSMRTGSVQFSYGARTIYAAAGLDEPEGTMIVERLAKRLPPSAV